MAAVAEAPPAVTGLAAGGLTTHSVTLTWNASPFNDGDPQNTYRVYEQTSTGDWTLVASPSAGTTVTFANLSPGTTHTYAVTLFDSDGNESPRSAPVTITTYAPPTITHPDPDGVAPRAAVGVPFTYPLVATGVPAPSFDVVSGPLGMSVDASGFVTWTPTPDQAGTATATVRAVNPLGEAPWTFTVPVAPAGSDLTAPSVVTGVTPSGPLRNGTDLSWGAATDNVGVDHYRLRVYSTGQPPVLLTKIDTPTGTTTFTLTDPALTFNSTYGVKVTAVDAAGNESDLSATPTVVFPTASVDVAPPTAPTNVAVSAVTFNSATFSWSASSDNIGVAEYRIVRRWTTPRYKSPPLVHYQQMLGGIDPAATSATVTGLTPGASYTMFVEAYDAAGNSARSALVGLVVPLPPTLADVFVSGSAWTGRFKGYLAARPGGHGDSALYGWRVDGSTTASAPLPFVNVDTVALRFNGNVPLAIVGANLAISLDATPLALRSVALDPADGSVILIRLAAPVGAGVLRVQIPTLKTAAGGPVDVAAPIRPGDVNGDGAVTAADFLAARARLGHVTEPLGGATSSYDPLADLDGSGAVTAADLLLARGHRLLP